jgi:hypothetical protein
VNTSAILRTSRTTHGGCLMRIAVLTLMFTGCDGGTEPVGPGVDPSPAEPGTSEPPPSTYIFDEDAPPEPTASLDEITASLQDALDLTMAIHATPVQEAYEVAMAGSTAACPYVYQTPDGSYWYDSCTANDGTSFDGYVFAYGASNLFDPGSGFVFDYWYAFGGATIQVPGGDELELAGLALWQKGVNDNGGTPIEFHYTELGGTFAWDGVEADGTWLRMGLDPDIVVSSNSMPTLGLSMSTLDGGFGGFGDGWAIGYDENVIGSELFGMPCEAEVSGTIGLRAPDGTWYDLQFDGAADAADPTFEASECDGCGQAFYRGEPMGQICADFSVLVEMGVSPW